MAFRISLGQYCAGNSFVHRLDPRAKLAIALIGMISVFFISNTAQLLFAFIVSLGIIVAAQAAPSKVLRSIRPVVIMLLVLSLFNLLLARGGQPLWTCGPFEITTGGIRAALLYPLRMIPAVIIMAVLLLTTTPTQLTDAFEAALSPLTRFGLPGHELALVFSLMLRFVRLTRLKLLSMLKQCVVHPLSMAQIGCAPSVQSSSRCLQALFIMLMDFLVHLTLVAMRAVAEEPIGTRWCIRAEISSQPYCAPPTLFFSRSYPR